MSNFPFTDLVEPASYASPTTPSAPFDPAIAYLMGQLCGLTYSQFDAASITTASFSSIVLSGDLQGYSLTASNLTAFTASELIEPPEPTSTSTVTTGPGDYATVQAGFGVQLTLTPSTGSPLNLVVLALRGTRTWDEWIEDAEAIPVPFGGITGVTDGLGSVHAGFYALYTIGTNGAKAIAGSELSPIVSDRATGSLARQIGTYVTALDGSMPLYVTGHSLGAALATYCALDVASNFQSSFSELFMYSLASPRVAVGLSDSFSVPLPTMGNQVQFLSQYQAYVPNTYAIVHASDIVPILPPLTTTIGPLTLTCAQATDPFTNAGSGATATATIGANGEVTSIDVDNSASSGYATTWPPLVLITGGGGSGAWAIASVSLFEKNVSVQVIKGGSGYTSAPAVQILSQGSLANNVISFCAQTGDIGNNHSCLVTYIPYLQALASGFNDG